MVLEFSISYHFCALDAVSNVFILIKLENLEKLLVVKQGL